MQAGVHLAVPAGAAGAFATALPGGCPGPDETPRPTEQPAALVAQLSESKARSVALQEPGMLVIGADQVAVLEREILSKPCYHE
jgi:predicted house-cleaning NTP pyrophosphatase (Maf/HAM1 superfamily)